MNSAVLSSPAKLNLFLAVTGRRPDGFHELVSVAAPIAWGDTLEVEPAADFTLECADPQTPGDESNLVLKAARAFRERTGWKGGAHFRLAKRIPVGAGLGGGSSNAVAALRGLDRLAGGRLGPADFQELAAGLGSDCPLFLHDGPVIMRGRGERVEPVPPGAAGRLRGRRVLLFKPGFGVATPWAYAKLMALAAEHAQSKPSALARFFAGRPATYLPVPEAEARLAAWLADRRAPAEGLLFNNLENAVFTKFLALPALLRRLRADFALSAAMSGSGSACFALLPDGLVPECVDAMVASIREAWGPAAYLGETRLS